MQANEIELVKRVQAKDEYAFDELYHTYYDRAMAIAYRLTNDRADAQDIVQESFLQVHKSIDTLQDPQYFYSWLRRIIHSKCVNMFYRNRNVKAIDPAKIQSNQTYEEKRKYMLPQEKAAYASEQEVLQEILSQMDDKYREVLELAYFEQLKLHEIARYLDLPLGTVKTRCRRAKEELKSRITSYEQQEHRRISFNVDTLFPGLATFSLMHMSMSWKQKVNHIMMGQSANIACVTIFTALAVSGGVMAVYDYEEAKKQQEQVQEFDLNGSLTQIEDELPSASTKPFGNYRYNETWIQTSREAYYVCINWASDLSQMKNKSDDEINDMRLIYEALRNADDQYYIMLQEKGWESDFLSLIE